MICLILNCQILLYDFKIQDAIAVQYYSRINARTKIYWRSKRLTRTLIKGGHDEWITQTTANPLGYEKIGKLLTSYAVPSIIALIINSLYNMVDQTFMGQGVTFGLCMKVSMLERV
ncbi:MAG: hypothetical protein K2K74_20155 [Lachnospiraceae bacterium]|nr:hypothetical protein [Lachnospiraceae bacterium]